MESLVKVEFGGITVVPQQKGRPQYYNNKTIIITPGFIRGSVAKSKPGLIVEIPVIDERSKGGSTGKKRQQGTGVSLGEK